MEKNLIKIDKPWGWEKLIEVNENYVVKELFMLKDNSCSLQYHKKKRETFYVIDGILKFEFGEDQYNLKEIILKNGDYYTIEPNIVHRMSAVENTIYLESSTNFLTDVVRLEDKYGRL